MLRRWGLLMVRLRWWVIGVWTLAFLLSLLAAPRVTSVLRSGFGDDDTESYIALRLMAEKLGVPESSVTVIFHSDRWLAADRRYAEAVMLAVSPLRELPDVSRILTYYDTHDAAMVAPNGHTSYVLIQLETDIDTSVDLYPGIRESIRSDDLEIWATGGIAILSDLNAASRDDLRRAELLTLPLVLIALLVVFGGLVAAGLPMAMGVISIVVTMALVYLLAQRIEMSVFVLNIAIFLGLGMAVDYSLLLVSRFREEVGRHPVAEAVAVTCATAGKAILFSAATTVIALSGLIFFEFMMLRSLGIGGVTVIVLSMAMALSLIPALLSVLGSRVDALAVIPRRATEGRFWHRLAGLVMRHPVAIIVPVAAGLLLLGLPFLQIKPGTPWAEILPQGAESHQGWEEAEERFGPGELSPIIAISTSRRGVLAPENLDAAYDFAMSLYQDPRVARVSSLGNPRPGLSRERYHQLVSESVGSPLSEEGVSLNEFVSDLGDASLTSIYSAFSPTAQETKDLVRDIRSSPPGGDLETRLTGATPVLMDTNDRLYSDFPKVVIYVTVASYVVLFLLFRSVVLPLKAVLLNFLSIFASFGALVFVFQQGHLEGLLGFSSTGVTEASVPIILFAVVFGLSMDYEVFLLCRVKEEYEATGDNAKSVALGMERSGRIITSAALVMVLVAGGLATGDVVIIKALGFGTALAIFIDSTIVRALLVPALMRVLSGLNWWAPRWLTPKSHPPTRSMS